MADFMTDEEIQARLRSLREFPPRCSLDAGCALLSSVFRPGPTTPLSIAVKPQKKIDDYYNKKGTGRTPRRLILFA
jgi:hypothetical protein